MKKVLITLSLIFVLVGLASCESKKSGNRESEETTEVKDEKDANLKNEIKAINKKCPINMGIMGILESVKYNEQAKEIEYIYSVNDFFIPFLENIDNNGLKFVAAKNNNEKLTQYLIDAGASITYVFKSATSNQKEELTLSLDDLKSAMENPMSDYELNKYILELNIETTNSQYPMGFGNGIIATHMSDEGDNVVYVYSVDECMLSIENIINIQDKLKQSIVRGFSDFSFKEFVRVVVALDKGLVYRYCGDISGETFEIAYTTNELKRHIRD